MLRQVTYIEMQVFSNVLISLISSSAEVVMFNIAVMMAAHFVAQVALVNPAF